MSTSIGSQRPVPDVEAHSEIDPIQWCRDRLMVPRQPLMASLLFTPQPQRDQILVIRTLISEIASISDLNNEPSLANAKLAWWRNALSSALPHPAILAFNQVITPTTDLVSRLVSLIDSVEASIPSPRFETTAQAWAHAQRLGGSAAAIELSMLMPLDDHGHLVAHGKGSLMDAIVDLGAAGYWARWLRDLPMDARSGQWFVPLDVQADYQLNRQTVADGPPTAAWSGLVRTLVATALKKMDEAESSLTAHPNLPIDHLLISAALDRRLLGLCAQKPLKLLGTRLLPGHAGNVWVAWRQARRCRTSAP